MATKKGKGGYGSEEYDPETGKYVKGGSTYHAGVNQSVADIIADLKSGAYDDPEEGIVPSQLFNSGSDEELEEDEEIWNQKNEIISYIQKQLDEAYTAEAYTATDFPKISLNEFYNFARECEQVTSAKDRDGFYYGYRGDPSSFEFNKALRMGFEKFYNLYPRFLHSPNLSPEAITQRAKKLQAITSAWTFPEDKQVYRFVDTAPLVSWFKSSGVFDGMNLYTNEYNLEMLEEGYDKNDLVKRLKNLIGTKVPPDGSFTSFSCVARNENSHMVRNLNRNKRHIKINYNVRQGTPAFISSYENESEGLFNRNVGFYIQDVKLENIDGEEIIILEYGIQ